MFESGKPFAQVGNASSAVKTLERLEEEIAELAAHMWAATARFLALIAEFDERNGWNQWGIKSCAEWLSWRCGLSPGAAREHVRTARELTKLPRVAEAFRRGEFSYSKVRAITRAASNETEETLLEWARHSTAAQLEQVVRGVRRARRLEDPMRMARTRSARYWYDEDGMFNLQARLTPEEGEIVLRALQAASTAIEQHESKGAADVPGGTPTENAADDVPPETSSAGPDVPAGTSQVEDPDGEVIDPLDLDASPIMERRRADALGLMAETFLATSPTRLSGPDRSAILLSVSLADLLEGADACETSRGTALHPETAKRLGCDGSAIRALRDSSGRALDIGRRTRVVPAPMRRLLKLRDGGCRFPGCSATVWVDAHHIWYWGNGGPTCLENLVLLCRKHHKVVHEGGFRIERRGESEFSVFRPDGRNVEHVPASVAGGPSLEERHGSAGLAIGPNTCASRWDGARPDYGLAVSLLLERQSAAG